MDAKNDPSYNETQEIKFAHLHPLTKFGDKFSFPTNIIKKIF